MTVPNPETEHGNVPLWLYEVGVSLQAVATYGWLHGQSGHSQQTARSYATLAKELGVSRGSAVAYVKELTAVGAVRIADGGLPGQQVNGYVLAVDGPFDVPDRANDLSTSGWAYALGGPDRDRVKIGRSNTPKQRLQDLQSGSPVPLAILWQAEGGAALERHLHNHFAARRLHGEWFNFAGVDAITLISQASATFEAGQ